MNIINIDVALFYDTNIAIAIPSYPILIKKTAIMMH